MDELDDLRNLLRDRLKKWLSTNHIHKYLLLTGGEYNVINGFLGFIGAYINPSLKAVQVQSSSIYDRGLNGVIIIDATSSLGTPDDVVMFVMEALDDMYEVEPEHSAMISIFAKAVFYGFIKADEIPSLTHNIAKEDWVGGRSSTEWLASELYQKILTALINGVVSPENPAWEPPSNIIE